MKLPAGAPALADRDPLLVRANGSASSMPSARVPLRTKQRKPGYIALAVVLIVGLAALGGYFYTSAGAKTPVVVVIREVPAGHLVTRADLSTIDVSGGVVAIAGANLGSVLGQSATVDLLPNMLLQRSMVSGGPLLAADQAQVGVAVTGGQIPADGLVPGDTVEVLQLPVKGSGVNAAPASANVLVAKARVFSSRQDPSSAAGTLVTLVVPAGAAAAIATASSSGLIALIKVAA